MAINRSNIAKQLLPGLNAIFGITYKEVDNEHAPLFRWRLASARSKRKS